MRSSPRVSVSARRRLPLERKEVHAVGHGRQSLPARERGVPHAPQRRAAQIRIARHEVKRKARRQHVVRRRREEDGKLRDSRPGQCVSAAAAVYERARGEVGVHLLTRLVTPHVQRKALFGRLRLAPHGGGLPAQVFKKF